MAKRLRGEMKEEYEKWNANSSLFLTPGTEGDHDLSEKRLSAGVSVIYS